MINYKRISIMFLSALLPVCSLYFFMEKAIVNGAAAGYAAGALNFYIIALSVKWMLSGEKVNPAVKAALSSGIFLIKIALFAAVIAFLIIMREHYNIFGFLAGFTLSLIIIGAESVMARINTK